MPLRDEPPFTVRAPRPPSVGALCLALCFASCRPAPARPSLPTHARSAPTDAGLGAQPSVTVAPEPEPARAPSVEERLAEYAVDNDRPWRGTLYSWAPPERALDMVHTRTFLTATVSSGPAPTPFSRLLLRLRQRTDETGAIARALVSGPDVSRFRYAWAGGFATALGFQRRSYGTTLVRATLRPDALVLRLDPLEPKAFSIFDSANRTVPLTQWSAVRARVAAVFHVRRDSAVRVAFREYVLCNPAAIASWSVGTTEIRDEIAREIQLVRDVRDALGPPPAAPARPAWLEWDRRTRAPSPSLRERWTSAMATAAEHYEPTWTNLDAVVEQLRKSEHPVVFGERAP